MLDLCYPAIRQIAGGSRNNVLALFPQSLSLQYPVSTVNLLQLLIIGSVESESDKASASESSDTAAFKQ